MFSFKRTPIPEKKDKPTRPVIMPHGTESPTLRSIFFDQDVITKTTWRRYFVERWILIPLIILILIPIGFMVSAARYSLMSPFWSQRYSVQVVDYKTLQPIINATVVLGNINTKTNDQGLVNINTHIGQKNIYISSNYYSAYHGQALVPFEYHGIYTYRLKPIGVEVPISVVNKISLLPLGNALISADYSYVETDINGKATMVLPSDVPSVPGTITATGYNNQSVTVQITPAITTTNQFQVPPVGKIYFLSNSSGTVDVEKINLDGSGEQTVLTGTSSETPSNTQILASHDWRYIALLTNKDGKGSSLYVIDTSNDKLVTVDSASSTSYRIAGWTPNDSLIYVSNVIGIAPWEPYGQKLQAFNAYTNKNTLLDQNLSLGFDIVSYGLQSFDTVNVMPNDNIIYTKTWAGTDTTDVASQNATINIISYNGKNKQTLQSLVANQYTAPKTAFYSPVELEVSFNNSKSSTPVYFDFQNGSLNKTTDANLIRTFSSPINNLPTYLMSPTDKYSLWSESQPGANAVLVGDESGNNTSQVASLDTSLIPFGWYSDKYVLLSQSSKALYIMPVGGIKNQNQLVKITGYL